MWIAKLKIYDENDVIASRAKKFKVTVMGYLHTRFKKKGNIYLSGAGVLIGNEKNKKYFINDLKKERKIQKLELKGDFFIAQIMYGGLKSEEETLVDPQFIYPKPIIILPSGEEIWEFASWDRNSLIKKINLAKRKYNAELLKIKRTKLSTLAIFNVLPELTKKQKQALELAISNGYYEYPRKTELRKLAKKMGISFSTFQAHLRKAEAKLLPYIVKTSF